MVLIIGAISGSDIALLQSVHNFCAEVCRQAMLKTCLIFYPADPDARSWVQPFVSSLKSVGVQRVNLLIPTPSFTPEDIETIERMGIAEVILIEEDFDYHYINSERIQVRVWLNWSDSGNNHEKLCCWHEFISNLLSVEVSPFKFLQETKAFPATNIHHTACDCRDAIITISPNSSIELNLGPNWHGAECSAAAHIQSSWKSKLPLRVYCRDCAPASMLDFPAWLDAPDEVLHPTPEPRYFHDHVKGDLMKLGDVSRQLTLNRFLDRVKENATR